MKSRIRRLGVVTTLAAMVAAPPVLSQGPGRAKAKSGVVKVLDFEAEWTQNMLFGPVHPAVCQTEAHLAGPNEVAVINIAGFPTPNVPLMTSFSSKQRSQDWLPFDALSALNTTDGMSDFAAQVSTTKKMDLNGGGDLRIRREVPDLRTGSGFVRDLRWHCHGRPPDALAGRVQP